jgi:16S rRNA (uracil1498-N3)-methyltransferase
MSTSRLFSPVQLRANAALSLGSEQARYVGRVLRLRPGDALTVFDGSGGEYPATVSTVTKEELNLSVGAHDARNTESPLKIRLVQGVSRGERMDLVIQKATELGVHRISPVVTDFSVVKLPPDRAAKRRDHWRKVAQSACEQCQRNIVPIIDAPQSLLDWFGDNAGADRLQLILQADAADAMPAIEMPGSDLTLLVGPEGGFSEAEHERATVAGLKAVSLGPRIMRTETAALAALAIAQATWGDYRAPSVTRPHSLSET